MLTNDQTDKLQLLLSTTGWNEVMKPALENRVRQAIHSLILPAAQRAEEDRNDETLRARIEELTWMLTQWQKEIDVNRHNRQLEEEAALAAQESPDGQILSRW